MLKQLVTFASKKMLSRFSVKGQTMQPFGMEELLQ
jgi:hypothetical protein